jgi:2-polyprenyl-6-methoxyphenol hydroxylase-like FAD-dependent oxidoreductase
MHAILTASLGGLPIRAGRTVERLQQVTGGCQVTFDDQSHDVYDLVVGADGCHSQMRQLAISSTPPSYSGNVCWRFFAPNSVGIDNWTVMLARGRTLLAIPVDQSTLYVYADLTIADAGARQLGAGTDLCALFTDFGAPLAPLLREAGAAQVHFSRIETVQLRSWFNGRVVLIGDAAHACSPSMAEGAGMACEDALHLARAVASATDGKVALAAFAERRAPRVGWVQAQSNARDRLRRLPGAISSRLLIHAGAALYRRSYRPLRELP